MLLYGEAFGSIDIEEDVDIQGRQSDTSGKCVVSEGMLGIWLFLTVAMELLFNMPFRCLSLKFPKLGGFVVE